MMEKTTGLKKEIGLLIATALVTGNMMGSGIFMLPATLASKAGPGSTILAWILTGLGSIFLALSFANLGSKIPKTGGPYEYSKKAFGDFAGFMNAWLYWNGSWIGNAAVVIAVTSYAGSLIPVINENHLYSFLFSSIVLWVFTFINILGVKRAGEMQTAITIFELVLFAVFMVITAIHFNPANLMPLFPEGKGIGTLNAAAAATMWAFLGLESASITAGEIKNAERNVKLSTVLGMLIALVMYLGINFLAMGAMPQESLAQSTSPIVDILAQYLGKGISTVILAGAVVSILGTTIGWLLSTARVAYAAGKDGVFPGIFAKIHPRFNTPYTALIIGSVLVNILLLMNYTKSLMSAFSFVILLATLAFLPVYASTAAAEIMLLAKREKKLSVWNFIKNSFLPLLGLAYAGWTIYGSGAEAALYGFILMLMGVPFYIYMKMKDEKGMAELRKFKNES